MSANGSWSVIFFDRCEGFKTAATLATSVLHTSSNIESFQPHPPGSAFFELANTNGHFGEYEVQRLKAQLFLS